MKKVVILLLLLVIIIAISFSGNFQETKKVLLAAELIGFEVAEQPKEIGNKETIDTSLKKVGIVTYINPETNQFVALGHSLTSSGNAGENIEATCYQVEIEQTTRRKNNNTTSRSVYLNRNKQIGHAYYDSYCGVYGEIDNVKQSKYEEIETANRYEIKKGKANILIRLDGEKLESYDVEIIAVNYLDNNKNIRIKITDDRLINETGGIVQGMSGTPVIQNGKLIGAINAVSATDSKDAYAVFIDKII